MNTMQGLGRVTESLARLDQHQQTPKKVSNRPLATPPTIALSRDAGCRGTAVALAVAGRLGWPVYDHQLIERIAEQMQVRPNLLDTIDERQHSWTLECVEWLALGAHISDRAYFHRLLDTLRALGAKGECVIVGRGAAFALPAPTTLRVRLVSDRAARIAEISRERGLDAEAAARYMETTDRERVAWLRDHFGKSDPADPVHYDLVLNTSRWPVDDCADLIVAGLQHLQKCGAGSGD